MKVKRITVNIATEDIGKAKQFYQDILNLEVLMDHGWIVTYGSAEQMDVQISFASEGGNSTRVPDLSIEVDEVDMAYDQLKTAGFVIEYELTNEPWGVRRFYVRDPFGRLVNILSHL
ncbi:Glyoxalase-like domain-containing protein [Mucilaginibacter lappiensis]|uniref:Catechol 2,3-dioxygenase-like lactoylglutathione lyase family enzyme n=1 Tax=Mucilaginibacter lappiensis TaxID=354630 RepID=A0ABR6PFT7_9SPHI|nr:VOC family protein [Mucilaginibacter lappiensis]MBB6108626.1 catechol 2,3-dioxygenase-like lactoylglutathione lyase family enzyme [Mucilaginibacter lappiensis]SIQ30355.1 Glyoxalase-like domain-containing protein [Mucilaginibacter lappiensis]